MGFRAEVSRDVKWRERRRGVRLNSSVPVRLEWNAPDGAAQRAEAQTRVVNPYGCLVVIPHDLALDQPVRLTNLRSGQSNPATVVWKGKERVEGWELGIEMVNPEMDFWGMDL
jgi:hypothetical protein